MTHSPDDEFRPLEQLRAQLMARIASDGPMPVSTFMAEALFDPMAGYYATKDPLGADKDFITAPEISQMFGEFIGLWAAECWGQLGAPQPVQLAELGPGTGKMMSDALRAGAAAPGFVEAVNLSLIEASPALKMVQGRTLASAPVQPRWLKQIDDIPDGPSLIVSNEFLDCLPIREAVKCEGVWCERRVGLDPATSGAFAFVMGEPLSEADLALVAPSLRDEPDGTLVELRPADAPVIEALADRFKTSPGYALFIDYGSATPEPGDTLQALARHQKVNPLATPGGADLTAWVDFQHLAELGLSAGLQAFGPMGQGAFLTGLGIETRAAALASGRSPDVAARVQRQLNRLVGADDMGELFKVIAFASEGLPPPPGLDLYRPD
jgi:NADH dehydrogenase [ubiquinone] 1 alpha subcomplex assembly factor 7